MSVFNKITGIFRSKKIAVKAANILNRAYAEGTGNPDLYCQFDESHPEKVAINVAGLYAADTAASIIALLRSEKDVEKEYVKALEDIAQENLKNDEKLITNMCANLSWRAGVPFRDINSNPLNKIKREINMHFYLLSNDEKEKDLIQIVVGAKILLEEINK